MRKSWLAAPGLVAVSVVCIVAAPKSEPEHKAQTIVGITLVLKIGPIAKGSRPYGGRVEEGFTCSSGEGANKKGEDMLLTDSLISVAAFCG